MFPNQYNFSSSLKAKSIDDVVNGFISYIGYNTVEQYYNKNSINEYNFSNIKVPTLLIHSQNDPIIPISNISSMNDAINSNIFVCLRILKRGGHCPYVIKIVIDWLKHS